MSLLDVLIGLPLLWAIYKGFSNGLIVEIATLLALILGIYGAIHFSDFTAEFIRDRFRYDSQYLGHISFVITFLLIVVVVNILGKMINSLIEAIALGLVNRLLGIVFAVLKTVLILSLIVHLIDYADQKLNFISEEKKAESILYEPMIVISDKVFEVLGSDFNDSKERIEEKIKEKQPPVQI